MSFGVQTGPAVYKIIGISLILAPFAVMFLKIFFRANQNFNYVAGAILILVTLGYGVIMLRINS